VLHFVDGNLLDKDYELLPAVQNEEEAVAALVKQYYLVKNYAPKEILLPCVMEDAQLFSDLLMQNLGKRVHIRTPQRGDGVRLVELANKNAREEAERVTSGEERAAGTVLALQNLLKLDNLPRRMESFDISHTAGTDIVASMVVFSDGKPLKGDYRRFKLEGLQDQDDYRSMEQVLRRRMKRLIDGDKGFSDRPDLLLIDGGVAHARVACSVLQEFGLQIPVYGMVKDHRHRTRALVTSDGLEISIQGQPSLFALIGQIQEETHRFAISYHRSLRSKHLRESQLDLIPGIGPVRKKMLLKHYKSVAAIGKASVSQLREVLPEKEAAAVYEFYHPAQGDRNL
jgi:excinuclease ABC subunit C